MTRTSLKWSALGALTFAFLFLGCPSGTNNIATLSMSANPRAIDDLGQMSTIAVDAVDEKGLPGTGAVTLTAAAGQLGSASVTLDKNGHGTTTFTCAKSADMNCKLSVKISASWASPKSGTVSGLVTLQVGPQPVNDSGVQDAGGGAGGGGGADSGIVVTSAKNVLAIGVGDSTIITATLTVPPLANQQIDFATTAGLLAAADGGVTATTFSATTDSAGQAFARLTESGTPGIAIVSATQPTSSLSGATAVQIVRVQSITFETTTCGTMTNCQVMGIKNSGFNESAQVKFKAVDSNSQGVPGLTVTFSATLPQGTTVSPSGVTDVNGEVVATVSSGPVIGSFQVHATVIPGSVETDSNTIGVRGAKPTNKGFGLRCDRVNLAAYDNASPPLPILLNCNVQLVDRFNNPVGTGTAVNLKVEAGFVPSSTTTNAFPSTSEGLGTFNFSTTGGTYPPTDVPPLGALAQPFPGARLAEPSYMTGGVTRNPRDGLVSMIAYVQGEEWFDDKNQNGMQDGNEQFIDQGEPLVDSNDNGVYDTGEIYIDSNGNNMWDGPNGVWDTKATVWTEFRLLYTDIPEPSQATFSPEPYGVCPNGVPLGGQQTVIVRVPDLNLNLIESNSSVSVAHTATKGSVAFTGGTTVLDGYGFGYERDLTDVMTNGTCDSATSTICEYRVFFTTWGRGAVGSFVVTGAPLGDVSGCVSDTASVTVNERNQIIVVTTTGAIN